ncbi:MAG: FAD-dependent oxidoreductase [Desulfobacterales bacterium]|nr:FAD-dependent oxidoreductase [Desulfobacterales bacterium]
MTAWSLGIEGEDLPGVIDGVAYLRTINLGKKVKLGKKVAIIGGGNTAIDCARTARRIRRKGHSHHLSS